MIWHAIGYSIGCALVGIAITVIIYRRWVLPRAWRDGYQACQIDRARQDWAARREFQSRLAARRRLELEEVGG